MDISTFFKNGDVSEPTLNSNGEGSFRNQFRGSFSDEKYMNLTASQYYKQKKQEKASGGGSEIDKKIQEALGSSGESKGISTGGWVAIIGSSVVLLSLVGFFLYRKYKK